MNHGTDMNLETSPGSTANWLQRNVAEAQERLVRVRLAVVERRLVDAERPAILFLPILDVEIDVAHRERHFDSRAVAAAEAVLQRDPVEPFAWAQRGAGARRIGFGVPLAEQEILRRADGEKALLGVAERERHHRGAGLKYRSSELGSRISDLRSGIFEVGSSVGLDRADHVVRVDRAGRKVGVPALQHRAMEDRLDVVRERRLVARLERAARIERRERDRARAPTRRRRRPTSR